MAMNILEEAVIYATIMHQGKVRKGKGSPYILHPLEVAQIISTMTDDIDMITAGVLHDIVEDTDGSSEEIRIRFGDRVADLVETETENKYAGEDAAASWKRRKEESLKVLKNTKDNGVRILWLADKLSNIRSLAQAWGEEGSALWNNFHMKDPQQQLWYYRTVAEELELYLNKTGAFKEFVKHINYIWPGTFVSEKTKYKKYKEVSIQGCPAIGRGAKSTVYRYNDEVIVKVYNSNNTFREIERENYLARQAFIAGIPTAISFGIVSVGELYGSMFELLDSNCVSQLISKNPERVDYYADFMADLALQIHATEAGDIDLPDYMDEVHRWIGGGIAIEDAELAARVTDFVNGIPKVLTMIHGDFHTGNVMIQGDEPLLIDMDRLSVCHPIVELSGLYMFYVGFGEMDRDMLESFMGFSLETAGEFFREFMRHYVAGIMGSANDAASNGDASDGESYCYDDATYADAIQTATDRAALLAYVRLLRRAYKKGRNLSEKDTALRDLCMDKIRTLIEAVRFY